MRIKIVIYALISDIFLGKKLNQFDFRKKNTNRKNAACKLVCNATMKKYSYKQNKFSKIQ